ncbi:carbohydrate-binding module family 18 protein, partial [Lepidopterella palustris CBS 459.81]
TLISSTNGQCGGTTGQTCAGSSFGNCCSSYGWCGSSSVYCDVAQGCQGGFGDCTTPSSVSTAAQPTSTVIISPDGTCGGTNGYSCLGSVHGDCCSAYGYCGSTSLYCDSGCQGAFGICTSSSPAGLPISLDGSCGGTSGQTCAGSTFGNCCSAYGYCGSTSVYCDTGCQSAFGVCT